MGAINDRVRLNACEYDRSDTPSVIVTVGVFGASSTFYVSVEQARAMADELNRVAARVEQLLATAKVAA